MQKHIKHTAFLLLLVVVYPFIFQSLHTVLHDHGHKSSHSDEKIQASLYFCSSHPESSCSHSSGQTHDDPSAPDAESECDKTDHSHDECPLCDHEFAKFNLKKHYYVLFAEEIFAIINTCYYSSPQILYTGNHISLRAPPIFILFDLLQPDYGLPGTNALFDPEPLG